MSCSQENQCFHISERKKDLGVPNAAPFKEQVLKEAEDRKRRLEEERERQKEKRKKERQALLDKKRNLQSIVKDAQKRTDDFNKKVWAVPEEIFLLFVLHNAVVLVCGLATVCLVYFSNRTAIHQSQKRTPEESRWKLH